MAHALTFGAVICIARKSLAKYGIKDARAELCAAMDKWASEGVPASQPFHGGQSPDRADLAVYGVVRSLEGNYATWKDVSEKADPRFWAWCVASRRVASRERQLTAHARQVQAGGRGQESEGLTAAPSCASFLRYTAAAAAHTLLKTGVTRMRRAPFAAFLAARP